MSRLYALVAVLVVVVLVGYYELLDELLFVLGIWIGFGLVLFFATFAAAYLVGFTRERLRSRRIDREISRLLDEESRS